MSLPPHGAGSAGEELSNGIILFDLLSDGCLFVLNKKKKTSLNMPLKSPECAAACWWMALSVVLKQQHTGTFYSPCLSLLSCFLPFCSVFNLQFSSLPCTVFCNVLSPMHSHLCDKSEKRSEFKLWESKKDFGGNKSRRLVYFLWCFFHSLNKSPNKACFASDTRLLKIFGVNWGQSMFLDRNENLPVTSKTPHVSKLGVFLCRFSDFCYLHHPKDTSS